MLNAAQRHSRRALPSGGRRALLLAAIVLVAAGLAGCKQDYNCAPLCGDMRLPAPASEEAVSEGDAVSACQSDVQSMFSAATIQATCGTTPVTCECAVEDLNE